jgi:hypothetical protein
MRRWSAGSRSRSWNCARAGLGPGRCSTRITASPPNTDGFIRNRRSSRRNLPRRSRASSSAWRNSTTSPRTIGPTSLRPKQSSSRNVTPNSPGPRETRQSIRIRTAPVAGVIVTIGDHGDFRMPRLPLARQRRLQRGGMAGPVRLCAGPLLGVDRLLIRERCGQSPRSSDHLHRQEVLGHGASYNIDINKIMENFLAFDRQMCESEKTPLEHKPNTASCAGYFCALRQVNSRYDDLCFQRSLGPKLPPQDVVLGLFWGR